MKVSLKLILFIMCIISPVYSYSKISFSMDSVYSIFGKLTQEAVVEKEYNLNKPGMLTINNIDGNITIATDWNKNSICLKAIKHASSEDDLNLVSIQTDQQTAQDSSQHLVLSTEFSNKTLKASVDYELIVPAHIQVNLNTENGSITINNLKGAITAKTINGPITIQNTSNTITAQTEETGSIVISQAQGNIKATTNKGDIKVVDASKSIIAQTQKGNIDTSCAEVLSTSRILLNAESSGTITLAMPSTVNATIHGKTEKGKLNSDHYITLKPVTLQLNNKTRRDFLERQVNGIIGTGETDIRLTSNNGNITILETT